MSWQRDAEAAWQREYDAQFESELGECRFCDNERRKGGYELCSECGDLGTALDRLTKAVEALRSSVGPAEPFHRALWREAERARACLDDS